MCATTQYAVIPHTTDNTSSEYANQPLVTIFHMRIILKFLVMVEQLALLQIGSLHVAVLFDIIYVSYLAVAQPRRHLTLVATHGIDGA